MMKKNASTPGTCLDLVLLEKKRKGEGFFNILISHMMNTR